MENDGSFGAGFWLKIFGTIIGVGLAVLLILLFIGNMFARWGFIGGMIVLGIVLLVSAWISDKREARKDREYGLTE